MKKNCWEFKKCGREVGGMHVHDLGVCPVSLERKLDGVHEGKNGGRACWVVAGSLCDGRVQGSYASKYKNCTECEFYNAVRDSEFPKFILSPVLLRKLREPQPIRGETSPARSSAGMRMSNGSECGVATE